MKREEKFWITDPKYIAEGMKILGDANKFAKKYPFADNDTLFNVLRDSVVAKYLGFDEINIKKHGYDARNYNGDYLEIKESSVYPPKAVFNDTSEEKARHLLNDKVVVALAYWSSVSELDYIVYGDKNNRSVGEYLIRTLNKQKGRKTQLLSQYQLLNKHNFKVLAIKDKDKVIKTLKSSRTLKNFPESNIYTLEEYQKKLRA